MNQSHPTTRRSAVFFLGVFIFLLYQALRILEPFFLSFASALIVCMLVYPLHRSIQRGWPKGNPSLHAGVTTLLVVVLGCIPFLGLITMVVSESALIIPILTRVQNQIVHFEKAQFWAQYPRLAEGYFHLQKMLSSMGVDVQDVVLQTGLSSLENVSQWGTTAAKGSVIALAGALVTIVILFFLFRDGERYLHRLIRLIPLPVIYQTQIIARLESLVYRLVRGTILTLLAQMTIAMTTYWMLGVPAAIILGLLTGVASLIPLVGTALIWIPIGVYYLSLQASGKALIVFTVGVFISTMDNVLKPYLIGRKAPLSLVFLFLGLLGGMKLYGIKGVLIGPLVMTLVAAFIEIYAEYYLPEVERRAP